MWKDRLGRAIGLVAIVTTLAIEALPARAQGLGGIGVMGDSYSDEYRFYRPDRGRARNWVEILAATRGLNFGPQSLRRRPEPRNQGFAFDWARENSTTDVLIGLGQHTGLAEQVRRGQVRLVVLFIGGNDFLIKVLRSPDPAAVLQTVVPEAVANVTTAVETILAASPRVRVVVVTISNVGFLPITRGLLLDPQGRALLAGVTEATRAYNDFLRSLAAREPRIVLADYDAEIQALAARTSPLVVGGLTIDLLTPGNSPEHFVLADGIHTGTVAQGLFANLIVRTLNAEFGTRIRPLSEREIVRVARAAAGSRVVATAGR